MTGLASLSLIGSVVIFIAMMLIAALAVLVLADIALNFWHARQLGHMARNLKGKTNGRFHTGK